MRRALWIVTTMAALAGCTVETEGAACTKVGTGDECPSGQTCSLELLCSKSPFKPCEAASSGSDLAVDPVHGNVGVTTGGVATGFPDPPGCRFRSLADALSAALGASPRTVKVYGNGAPSVDVPLGASTPVVVPGNVTLTTDLLTPDPTRFVLTAAGATGDLLHVEGGATVVGFTIRNTNGTGDGLAVVCGSGNATLDHVTVDGALNLARGVVAEDGVCGLTATALDVSNVNGPGLVVNHAGASVTVNGGSFHDNAGEGVVASLGTLTLQGAPTALTVQTNALGGIRIEPPAGTVAATIGDVAIKRNGGVGLNIRSASSSSVSIARTVIAQNGGTDYGSSPARQANAVILFGNPPSGFSFKDNLVCWNGQHDEDVVGIWSSGNWDLSGPSDCSAGNQNTYAATLADTDTGRYVRATGGGSDVRYNRSYPDPPASAALFENVQFDITKTCVGPSQFPVECE